MKMLFNVNQAAALKQGIDAPSSTVTLEVDPAELTVKEREVLSLIIINGFDCTKAGILLGDDKTVQRSTSFAACEISLVLQDIYGLRSAIALALEEATAYWELKKAKRDKDTAEADGRIDELLAKTVEQTTEQYLYYRCGEVSDDIDNNQYKPTNKFSVAVDWPVYPVIDYIQDASPAKKAELDTVRLQVSEKRKSLIETIRPILVLHREEETRKTAEKSAHEKAEYDALFSRLPLALRERSEAGYATDKEVRCAIRHMLRADAGYPEINPDHEKSTNKLTDAEYSRYRDLEQGIPDGAEISAVLCWDECTEVDEDGDEDVIVSNNKFNAARIEWSAGGVDVVAIVPLA